MLPDPVEVKITPIEPKINMDWVKPEDILDYWPRVRKGLDKIANMHDQWVAEDIYMMIVQGNLNLHVAHKGGEYVGFVVVQVQPLLRGAHFHVWAAHSVKPKASNVLKEAMPQLKQWARQANCKKITFTSGRKGWERNDIGFKPAMTNYEYTL